MLGCWQQKFTLIYLTSESLILKTSLGYLLYIFPFFDHVLQSHFVSTKCLQDLIKFLF